MPALSQHQRETLTNPMLNDKYAGHKQALGLNVAKVPSVNVHSLNEKLGLPK